MAASGVTMPESTVTVPSWRGGVLSARTVPEETAVALTYNRTTHAVMMATPADLEDFAAGFSRAEGIIDTASDIEELELVPAPLGIEVRMWIAPERMIALERRKRQNAGPTGCGLCGMDSLADAMRVPPVVGAGPRFTAIEIARAVASLDPAQGAQSRNPRRARGRVLAGRPAGVARGCRPAQCGGQADGRLAAGGARPGRRHPGHDEPHQCRTGAKGRRGRHRRARGRVRTHGACHKGGRSRRLDAGRGGPAGWVRGVHTSAPDCWIAARLRRPSPPAGGRAG